MKFNEFNIVTHDISVMYVIDWYTKYRFSPITGT